MFIANKDFFDVATGKHSAGEVFDEPRQRVARQLLRAGLVREYVAPVYEVKVVRPEVKAEAAPFRDVPRVDPEPPALAALRDSVRAASDVQPAGDPRSLERGAGSGPDTAGSAAPPSAGKPKDRRRPKRRV